MNAKIYKALVAITLSGPTVIAEGERVQMKSITAGATQDADIIEVSSLDEVTGNPAVPVTYNIPGRIWYFGKAFSLMHPPFTGAQS